MSKGKSPYQIAMRKKKRKIKEAKLAIRKGLQNQFEGSTDEEQFEMADKMVDSIVQGIESKNNPNTTE